MKTAAVYRNGPLVVLPAFIEEQFGLKFNNVYGSCLVSHVLFGIAAVTDIPIVTVNKAFNKHWKTYVGSRGMTLEQIAAPVEKGLGVKLSCLRHDTIDSALSAMEQGHIVLSIINVDDDIDFYYSDNSILESAAIKAAKHRFTRCVAEDDFLHSFMLIGHDKHEGTVLLRDIRSSYSYKGYGKIKHKALKKHPHAMAYVEVIVQ